jgi:hypothetical protein
MRTALGGLLVIAGIAGLVIASAHGPYLEVASNTGGFNPRGGFDTTVVYDWSRTTLEAIRIAGWGSIVVGLVVLAFALVREIRAPRAA